MFFLATDIVLLHLTKITPEMSIFTTILITNYNNFPSCLFVSKRPRKTQEICFNKGVEDIPRTGDGVSKIIKTSAQGIGSQAEIEGSSGK